jgi:hypothetical protein
MPFRHVARVAFLAALLAALALALCPASYLQGAPPGGDKVHHFLAFLVLQFLGAAGWPKARTRVAMLLLSIATLIELFQGTPMIARDRDLGDWFAGAGGSLAALLCLKLAQPTRLSVPR